MGLPTGRVNARSGQVCMLVCANVHARFLSKAPYQMWVPVSCLVSLGLVRHKTPHIQQKCELPKLSNGVQCNPLGLCNTPKACSRTRLGRALSRV